jgi:hypothetical protein
LSAEIALVLYLSEASVKTPVNYILTKLRLHGRVPSRRARLPIRADGNPVTAVALDANLQPAGSVASGSGFARSESVLRDFGLRWPRPARCGRRCSRSRTNRFSRVMTASG